MSEVTMIEGLQKLFENQEMVDFFFKFPNNKKLGVHSVILAAQSDVFHAMLNGPLKEKSPVQVQDVAFSVFKKLIQLMYQCDVEFEELEDIFGVYKSAHKYNCIDVMQKLSYLIVNDHANMDTVDAIYAFSTIYDAEGLQKYCHVLCQEKVFKFFKNRKSVPELEEIEAKTNETVLKLLENISTKFMQSSNLQEVITGYLHLTHMLVHCIDKLTIDVMKFEKESIQIELMERLIDLPDVCSDGIMKKKDYLFPKFFTQKPQIVSHPFFVFTFPNTKNCISVHKFKVSQESNILANLMQSRSKEVEIKDTCYNVFKKIIQLMYNVKVGFGHWKEAAAFYDAAKKLNFDRGVSFSRYYLIYTYGKARADEIFSFGKMHNDELMIKGSLLGASRKIKGMIEVIFHRENLFVCDKKQEKAYDQIITEMIKLLDITNIQEKFAAGLSLLKVLTQKLDDVIVMFFNNKFVMYQVKGKNYFDGDSDSSDLDSDSSYNFDSDDSDSADSSDSDLLLSLIALKLAITNNF